MTTNTLTELTSLAPMDGRYATAGDSLRPYFSEFGLIHYRVIVEIRWLLFLANNPDITECHALLPQQQRALEDLTENFSIEHAKRVKAIEKTTNHDVKAVEYFLREFLHELDVGEQQSRFVHFACTSEDINNLAYALAMRNAREHVLIPLLGNIYSDLDALSKQHSDVAMLSRTHGQTASPTTLGKEIRNVAARLARQIEQLGQVEILGKMNGAVGNFNAHQSAYPDLNWPLLGQQFVASLGLTHNPHTTQIEPHDWMAEFFQTISRTNTILIDWCRDVWGYISLGYFKQLAVSGEVGSSTMPHKINPIQFENGEGNLGLANSVLTHLAQKLPISRWQRDLTDSTVLRNIGVALGWSVVAYASIRNGMGRMAVNPIRLEEDLNNAWEVLAEPIQTVMKRHGIEDAYEQLKALTRGQAMTQSVLVEFIQQIDIPEQARKELLELSPQSYLGYAQQLANFSGHKQ